MWGHYFLVAYSFVILSFSSVSNCMITLAARYGRSQRLGPLSHIRAGLIASVNIIQIMFHVNQCFTVWCTPPFLFPPVSQNFGSTASEIKSGGTYKPFT